MFGMLRERPVVKATIAAVGPLVDRSRASMGEWPTDVWLDPYLVGLLGKLIAIAVKRISPALGESSMASVQARAWAALTGLDACLFGPEVVALTAREDPAFLLGCENAAQIAAGLHERLDASAHLLHDGPPFVDDDTTSILWERYFDDYLGGRPPRLRL